MSLGYIIHLANYSDGILYILAVLLLLAIAVMLDRFWSLRITLLRGARLIRRTAEHAALSPAELTTLRDEAGSLPEAELLDAACAMPGWSRIRWAADSMKAPC